MKLPSLFVVAVAFPLVLVGALPEYNPDGIKNLIPIPSTHPRSAMVVGGGVAEGMVLTDGPIWVRGAEGQAGEDKFKNVVHPVDSREVAGADKVSLVRSLTSLLHRT